MIQPKLTSNPKILSFDLETSYKKGTFFDDRKWEASILEVTEPTQIISFSAKWLEGKQITKAQPDYKGYKKGHINDELLVKDLWALLDEADILIAHNGADFDIKVANDRFLYWKLGPPSPAKLIDTKREAKKIVRLPSYSMDDVCAHYGLPRKLKHEGKDLWYKCIELGDEKAWNTMAKYNKQDVLSLESLYLTMRPWMKSHPSHGIFTGKLSCPKCGSAHIVSRGFDRSKTMVYRKAVCKDCASWMRVPEAEDVPKPMISI